MISDTEVPENSTENSTEKATEVDNDTNGTEEATNDDSIIAIEEDKNEKKNVNKKDIKKDCRFFLQNRCKFGASGKGCAFVHKKICQKFLKNGTDGRFGCNGCNNFHPKMCRNSRNTKKCFTENCRFIHKKGTLRKQEKGKVEKAKDTKDKNVTKGRGPKTAPKDFLDVSPAASMDLLEMKKEVQLLKSIVQGLALSGSGQTNPATLATAGNPATLTQTLQTLNAINQLSMMMKHN